MTRIRIDSDLEERVRRAAVIENISVRDLPERRSTNRRPKFHKVVPPHVSSRTLLALSTVAEAVDDTGRAVKDLLAARRGR